MNKDELDEVVYEQIGRDYHMLSYIELKNRREKASRRAKKCREDYKELCKECWGYILCLIPIYIFYKITIVLIIEMNILFVSKAAIVSKYAYFSMCFVYVVFILRKIWTIYMEGESPRARWLASETNHIPLTLLAERYENEVLKMDIRINEMERDKFLN